MISAMKKLTPILLTLLCGCVTGNLSMQVDPSLEGHAKVFKVSRSGGFLSGRTNMSFGDYHVTRTSTGFTTITESSSAWLFWLNLGFNLGLPELKNVAVSKTNSFELSVGDVTWHANCLFQSHERDVEWKAVSSTLTMWSQYVCRYTRPDHEPWVLSISLGDSLRPDISMANSRHLLTAHATNGDFVMADGRVHKTLPIHTGYTWEQGSEKPGAVSFNEKTQRIWLDVRNSDEINDAIAMANSGLLIYHWQILPSTKRV